MTGSVFNGEIYQFDRLNNKTIHVNYCEFDAFHIL